MATLFLDSDRERQSSSAAAAPKVAKSAPAPSTALDYEHDPFFVEKVLGLAGIIVVALWFRAQDPNYSTAYMDESVYVVYGRMFLSRHFEAPLDSPLRWSFGWYLWPVLSALADRIGGLIAVREMAALMGTFVVGAVYGITRRLYGAATALGTAAIFAVLGPAIMTSRIATRDTGALFFFAIGLWLYVRAWQEDERGTWFAAAMAFFAAFLCKYIVAIYFPFLVLLTLRRNARAALCFSFPITALAAFYGGYYWTDLNYLVRYGGAYESLKAVGWQFRQVYFWTRIEFWLIAACALIAVFFRKDRKITLLLWLGAATGIAFQLKMRPDFDWWKHVTYALLFLTPAAVHGLISLAQRIGRKNYQTTGIVAISTVLALAIGSAASGKLTHFDRLLFWPDADPVLSYFEGRLGRDHRVLVDDSVFRYYFTPNLHQWQIADPFYFHYENYLGEAAYADAVRDGAFDYIILDGGMGEEARRMNAAIDPYLDGYELRMKMADPVLAHPIKIYERKSPAVVPLQSVAQIAITAPLIGAAVPRSEVDVLGQFTGAPPNSYVRVEAFTDRWYSLGRAKLNGAGGFKTKAVLAGQAHQQCSHMLRARLYGANNRPLAVALNYGITRLNPDGSSPTCK